MEAPKSLRSLDREEHCENLAKASARPETGGLPKSRGPKAGKKGVEVRMNRKYIYLRLDGHHKLRKNMKNPPLSAREIQRL